MANNFPHTILKKNQRTDIETKDVEKREISVSKQAKNNHSSRGIAVPRGLVEPQSGVFAGNKEQRAGAAAGVEKCPENRENGSVEVENGEDAPDYYEKLTKKQQDYVMEFRIYAWGMLYRGQGYDDFAKSRILNTITKDIFFNFSKEWKDSEWGKYYRNLTKTVDAVAKYLENNPEKYLPPPYAVHVKGKGYFDAENKNGFFGAIKWLSDNKRQLNQYEAQRTVKLAIKHLKSAKLDNGKKLPVKLKELTYSQLYNFYEAKLKRLRDEASLKTFYSFVSNPNFSIAS